jgi:hypothetical protein
MDESSPSDQKLDTSDLFERTTVESPEDLEKEGRRLNRYVFRGHNGPRRQKARRDSDKALRCCGDFGTPGAPQLRKRLSRFRW